MNKALTYQPRAADLQSRWYLVDVAQAQDKTLGRLAANIARVLRGKHRPDYTPHMNTGDHVIVVNAAAVTVSGGKRESKRYPRYTGYPGGLRTRTLAESLQRNPTFALTHAVRGMLQRNSLGEDMSQRLRVYAGNTHEHKAQKPQAIRFGELGEVIVATD